MVHRLTCEDCGDFAIIANSEQFVIDDAMDVHGREVHRSPGSEHYINRHIRRKRQNESSLESEMELSIHGGPRRLLIRSVYIDARTGT